MLDGFADKAAEIGEALGTSPSGVHPTELSGGRRGFSIFLGTPPQAQMTLSPRKDGTWQVKCEPLPWVREKLEGLGFDFSKPEKVEKDKGEEPAGEEVILKMPGQD